MYEEIPSVQLKWTSPPGSRVLLFSLLHNFQQLSFTPNGFSGNRGQMDYKVTSKGEPLPVAACIIISPVEHKPQIYYTSN